MQKTKAVFAWAAGLAPFLISYAAIAASPFDGVYNGTYAKTKDASNKQNCAPGGTFKITVTDGVFAYRAGGGTEPVKIAGNGTFSSQSANVFLSGKIENGTLTATLSRGVCGYSWSLNR